MMKKKDLLVATATQADKDRFWKKVNKNGPIPALCPELGPCWMYTGGGNSYGSFYFKDSCYRAHRFSYLVSGKTIPIGLVLDHECCTNYCVNPTHLEPVTQEENSHKSNRGASRKEFCGYGHAMVEDNLYYDKHGHISCKECRKRFVMESYYRRRATEPPFDYDARRWRNFWEKVEKTDLCWFWTGATGGKGYGKFYFETRLVYAHRILFEQKHGSIGTKRLVNTCGNIACVRPEHWRLRKP
jgi:hypothetical protein